jgi:putative ATPase
MDDLFSHSAKVAHTGEPLAERMRPVTLEEFVGQRQLLSQGRLLERALAQKQLPSLIFWGPPGTGKTTLARLLAARIGARFRPLSAVLAGVKDIRDIVGEAAQRRDQYGERTLLFIDEIHRFNKGQQDALLPHVEAGTVTLVGATTENPSFEVTGALLSRCKVMRLESLSHADLRQILDRAIADEGRGLGKLALSVTEEVRELLAREAQGDARQALATLEAAARIAGPGGTIDKVTVEEALQRKTLLYDKAGEEHYNVVSAFIKSMRGSDPDAAVYWMTRMLEAGEDPLFVLRRMVIFASEDIGNADPRALEVVMSAVGAFRFIGLPEGVLPLTQAAVYLATAPKSNSALVTYGRARKDVGEHGALAVPKKLRNAPTKLSKEMGYGAGYQYPHNFEGSYVAEEYLPEELVGRRYYEPGREGYERQIADRLGELRKKK